MSSFLLRPISQDGAVAQLGECLNGIQKVEGSNPFSSILIYFYLLAALKMRKLICLLIPFFLLLAQEETIDSLKRMVVNIGKLDFKSAVPVKYVDKKELKKYVETLFEKEYPNELLEKEELFIKLMGFVDSKTKTDLKEERKKIFIDNAGGLYNEKNGELFALEEYRDINYLNAMLIIHELRHGIQDQYFDLSKLLESCTPSDFDDRRFALLAAIEGDATMVMTQFGDLDPETMTSTHGADALLSFSPTAGSARVSNAPDVLKYQLTMPYIEGLNFVNYIYRKKSWKGVNKILLTPPVSTEQILHPGKYLKKETPLAIVIIYKPAGFSLYHSGVIGEYYLNVLLQTKNLLMDYAVGWGGDRFEIYKDSSQSSYFLIWESLWDTDEYCSNFYQVFRDFIESKYKVNFQEGKVKGRAFRAGKSTTDAVTDYFFMRKMKNRIFYVRSNDRNQINRFIDGGNYD